jgi:hypothetical protein
MTAPTTRSDRPAARSVKRRRVRAASARARWVAVTLVALFVAGGSLATPIKAQEPGGIEAAQQERELEYQARLRAFEAAQAAHAALQSRFDRWSEELEQARVDGDTDRRNQALAELQRLSTDLGSADRRVEETADAMEAARTAYMGLLDARLDILAQQIQFEPDADERAALFALYQDLTNRFDELDAARANGSGVIPVVLPNIRAQPTDGPVELRVKAELLEQHAIRFDTLIATIALEVEDLEKRSRRDRLTRGFLAGIDRFGDANLPVSASRGSGASEDAGSGPEGGDSLEDRLEGLRLLMDRYGTQRQEAMSRAESLRELAARMGSTVG